MLLAFDWFLMLLTYIPFILIFFMVLIYSVLNKIPETGIGPSNLKTGGHATRGKHTSWLRIVI